MTQRRTPYSPEEVARLNAEVPDLVGTNQFATMLGVGATNIDRVSGLPAAALNRSGGRLWRADVARAFAAGREKRLGEK
jgi:hypothetical protein